MSGRSSDTGYPFSTITVTNNSVFGNFNMDVTPYSRNVIGTEEIEVTVTLVDDHGI